jgi:hypothetical protein
MGAFFRVREKIGMPLRSSRRRARSLRDWPAQPATPPGHHSPSAAFAAARCACLNPFGLPVSVARALSCTGLRGGLCSCVPLEQRPGLPTRPLPAAPAPYGAGFGTAARGKA